MKKVFWTGLVATLVIWGLVSLGKLIYNSLAPLRDLIHVIFKHPLPGLEFILGIIVVLFLGFIVTHIKLPTSKIPIISKVSGVIKMAKDVAAGIATGRIKGCAIKLNDSLYGVGLTSNETIDINGQKMFEVLVLSSPIPSTGYTVLVPENCVTYLPVATVLRIAMTGGLANDREN